VDCPKIIQGDLDAMVATWPIAKAVAATGQLGVVSGTLLPVITARRLQLGDSGGHLRRAFDEFTHGEVARRVWEDFFRPGGKTPEAPFEQPLQPHFEQGPALTELAVMAGFSEVFLAREGRHGPVAIHFSERAKLPLLPTLYGALLAQVDCVIVAGQDADVAVGIARLCAGNEAGVRVRLVDDPAESGPECCFNPQVLGNQAPATLPQPRVLLMGHSTAQLAAQVREAGVPVDGVILRQEGGSEPPGEAELAGLRALNLPFWLGGLPATADGLAGVLAAGGAGLLVSTPFHYCEESELAADWKAEVFRQSRQAPARLAVEFVSAPVGHEVPIAKVAGSALDEDEFARRERFCDVGFLRQLYRREDGSVGYRCPGETVACHHAKGGDPEAAAGQRCFCNGMLAALGLGQVRSGFGVERPLLPAGEDLKGLARFCPPNARGFSAADVVQQLLEGVG
jgi:nitronate monooxygenase